MTFVVADRVQETGTVATGTGTVNLAGAVNGYQSFVSGIGSTNTTYYTIYDPAAYTWEVGLGTVTAGSPNTLARTTVYANSAGTAPSKISFSTSDTLTVFCTYPAETSIYTGSSASLNSLTLTSSITGSSNKGALNYGTLSYSDTGIFTSYQTSVNSYAQMILQNSLNGTAASADYVVSSDGGTATTNYGDFGINSSMYSGTGPLNAASMVYLYSQSTDLTIGTNSSNAIHFTINNAATDAMTINTSGSIAINGQTGSLGQVLISQGSSNPPSWGNAGGNLVTVDFTATSGQTTFSTTYVVGTVSVYRNGIKLGNADFTATNGSTVVLGTGAVAGDLIEIQSFTTLTLYSAITSQDFSGNGSTTAFTLNTNPANSASLLVAINGVVQDPANYTVSGNTLTFSTAPASGTNNISTRTLGVPATTAVSSFSAGTTGFSPTSAASGAVTLSGILNVANGGTGLTTLGSGYIPYGNGTSAFNSLSTFNFDGSTLFSPNASLSGNLTFSGTGSKILGDFTNATLANRTVIQTSTTNGATGVYVVPNGTSTAASIQALNAATPTNASKILIATNGTTDVQLVSGVNGSGTYLPLTFYNGGSEQMRLDTSGNFGIGTNNPAAFGKFVVSGSQPQIVAQGTSSTGGQLFIFSNGSTTQSNALGIGQGYSTATDGVAYISNNANADMILRTNASERMRILASGALAFGGASNYGTAGQVLTSQGSGSPPIWSSISTGSISYLVVGGGGSGGGDTGQNVGMGGGGAGGLISGSAAVAGGVSYTITVGAGGSSTNNSTSPGSSTTAFGTTAIGGGGGGYNASSANTFPGQSGASGGGGQGWNGGSGGSAACNGGSGTAGQGNAGGSGGGSSPNYGGGGGGGAGAAGTNGTNSVGSAGGIGVASTITGSSVYYAGGGGGGTGAGGTGFGAGGTGGGGNGAPGGVAVSNGVAGTANTGGGGGGSGSNSAGPSYGGAGGSGVVIIAYPSSYKLATATGSYTQTTAGSNYVFTFTGSGTITF